VVVAGFQGDDGGAAAGPLPRLPQRADLGVGLRRAVEEALADHGAAGAEDHAADHRPRAGVAAAAGRQRDGVAHRLDLLLVRHLPARPP
jgi:hypothetical protein